MECTRTFTALIQREDDLHVAQCLELDVASPGRTVEEARANLIEAIELVLETAGPEELHARTHGEFYVTRIEIPVPGAARTCGSPPRRAPSRS